MGFIFLPFCYFLYCLLSFCYRFFTLTRGRGCEFIFHFLILFYIFLIIFLILLLLFEGRKGA
jgi:hypothetical protein